MKKFKHFVIGGIENKIVNLVLFTVLLIVLAFGVVIAHQSGVLSDLSKSANEKQKDSMAQISNQTMTAVMESNLDAQTQMQAYIVDDVFREVRTDVEMLADYAQKLYNEPDKYPRLDINAPDASMQGQVAAQLMYGRGADLTSEAVQDETGLLGNLADMMTSMYSKSDHLSSCFISTVSDITLMADEVADLKLNNGGQYDFYAPERPWFIGAKSTKDLYFTGIETDYFSGRIGVVCAYPIYANGKLVAVAGADLFLEEMQAAIEQNNSEYSFLFVVDRNGHVIFSPKTEGIFQVKTSSEAIDLRNSEYPELSDMVMSSLRSVTATREVHCGNMDYYMAGAPMETAGWAIVSVVDKTATEIPAQQMKAQHEAIQQEAAAEYQNGLKQSKHMIWILLGTFFVIALLNAIILAKHIVRPMEKMTKRIGVLTGDDPIFEMSDEYRTDDEIQVLAESFADLSKRTREYIAENIRITAEKERIGAELNVATRIQADMLPSVFPPFPERREFDLYASMQPAKAVGGDFYDFFLMDDRHLAMVMADVSDKGVPAALFMVITKTLIKNRAQMGGSPAEILTDVNRQLCENNDSGMFVTIWLAILDIATGKGLAANAGHEYPTLRRAGGSYELIHYKHNPPAALMEEIPYTEHAFEMHPGDSLFVYTDGVTEAATVDKQLFGEERLIEALNLDPDARPKQVLENVRASIAAFTGDADQFDDMTMLCMQYYGNT